MWWLVMSAAMAGYGDPVDGHPNAMEREMHLWTNAVRAAPGAFEDAYPCAYRDFTETEKTPQTLLTWNADLQAAATFHSEDQAANGKMSHNSADGTSFYRRIERFYLGGGAGENVAFNYGGAYDVVINGWMCSDGHRENIMWPDFREYANGVAFSSRNEPYYTQNFGSAAPASFHPMKSGTGFNDGFSLDYTFLVDFQATDAPDLVEVVVNGEAHPMELQLGTATAGVYGFVLPELAPACVEYWFRATTGEQVVTLPEDGAYGTGECTFDDDATSYFEAKTWPRGEGPNAGGCSGASASADAEVDASGCTTGGGTGGLWALSGLLLMGLRRRR